MTIWITSLRHAPEVATRIRPARIVSLLSPYDVFPTFEDHPDEHHLCMPVHDILQDRDGATAPTLKDVERIVEFLEPWSGPEPLLIHCWAGVSRSTATAFIAACLHNPDADELTIAQALRSASTSATPNRTIVAHADAVLSRKGRMSAAVAAIGYGEIPDEVATPFMLESRFAPARRPPG